MSARLSSRMKIEKDQKPREEWMQEMYDLLAKGQIAKSIDVLFWNIDSLCLDGKFSEVDDFINELDVTKLDSNLLFGCLAIIRPAHQNKELQNYQDLFDRVTKQLYVLVPDRAENLVKRMKP